MDARASAASTYFGDTTFPLSRKLFFEPGAPDRTRLKQTIPGNAQQIR